MDKTKSLLSVRWPRCDASVATFPHATPKKYGWMKNNINKNNQVTLSQSLTHTHTRARIYTYMHYRREWTEKKINYVMDRVCALKMCLALSFYAICQYMSDFFFVCVRRWPLTMEISVYVVCVYMFFSLVSSPLSFIPCMRMTWVNGNLFDAMQIRTATTTIITTIVASFTQADAHRIEVRFWYDGRGGRTCTRIRMT